MKRLIGLFGLVLALSPLAANALLIGPGDAVASGPENNMPAIYSAISGTVDVTELQYVSNAGGGEEGDAAGDYHVVYSNSVSDPSDADIIWDGPGYVMDAEWLLVKDGNQDPAWYLFDISGWDGMETISLRGFWPAQGAISNVRLFGGVHVPEPGTLGLLGAGLLAIGLLKRKQQKA